MSAADSLRGRAHEYELEAERAGEHVPAGTVIPAGLKFEIQRTVFAAVACALREVAEVVEEELAA